MAEQPTTSSSTQPSGKFKLVARQLNHQNKVTPRIIYEKDKDVVFIVEGKGVAQAKNFWWDLKGDGNRNAPYNGPNNGDKTSSRTIKYTNNADAAGNLQLENTIANAKKSYNAKVSVTDADDIVHECSVTVRVALSDDVGDEFPANLGSPPGSAWQNTNAYLLGLYNWTEANQPGLWSALTAPEDSAAQTTYGLHVSLIGGPRIQVATVLASTAQTAFPTNQLKLYGVFLREGAAGVETAFSHRVNSLRSIVNHEWVHVQQFKDWMDNPLTSLWPMIQNSTIGTPSARSAARRVISEVEAYNSQLSDNFTTFRFALFQNVLGNFIDHYITTYRTIPQLAPVPALQTAVRSYTIEQCNAALATFPEFSDKEYDFWIEPPK